MSIEKTDNNNKKDSIAQKTILALWALLPLISINMYYFGANGIFNSFLNIFLYLAILFLTFKAYAIHDKRLHRISLFTAVFSSAVIVTGHSVYRANSLSCIFGSYAGFQESFMIFIGFIILLYFVFKICFNYLKDFDITSVSKNNRLPFFDTSKQSLLILWAIIFICRLPCYFAYYPGIYSYDIVTQTKQALGEVAFSRFHPVVHTFLFMVCIKFGALFGGATAGLVTYSVLQMLIMSFICAFAVWYMAKINVRFGLRIAALAYFALNPMDAIFSFMPIKDVPFSGLFMLVTIMFIEIVRRPDRFFKSYKRQLIFVVLLILLCLFRNNALYAVLLVLPFFLYLYRKRFKSVICISVTFLLCFYFINGPLFSMLGVEKGDTREVLCVPMQQIANTVVNHEKDLSKEERAAIAEILNYDKIKTSYNPRFADPIKANSYINNFLNNPGKYISLWASLFKKYPGDYIDAFLSLNLPYWHPDCVQPDKYSNRFYMETYIYDNDIFIVKQDSKIPSLLKFYQDFASGKETQKIPVVSHLFSIGFPIWFIFISGVIFFVKKQRKLILVLLPAFFLWFTFMAGPVSNLRYIYPIIACYPIYLIIIMQGKIFTDNPIQKKKQTETDTDSK